MYENRKAFRTMIGVCEGTVTHPLTLNDGYDVIVTGIDARGQKTPEIFTDYTWHPFAIGKIEVNWRRPKPINSKGLESTASGRYQILRRFWLIYAKQLGLKQFDREAQDAYVDQQLRERSALPLIDGGYLDAAVRAVSGLWASMPGRGYADQHQRSMEFCRVAFANAGGRINSP